MPDRNGPWLLLDFFQANLERACESGHLRESLYSRPKCGMQLAELREYVSPVIGNQRANTWIQLERDNGQQAGI